MLIEGPSGLSIFNPTEVVMWALAVANGVTMWWPSSFITAGLVHPMDLGVGGAPVEPARNTHPHHDLYKWGQPIPR